jgi:mannosyltransferase
MKFSTIMLKINKEKVLNFIIPMALFLTAFLWKFINAGDRDISLDEPFTIFHAHDSLKNILLLPLQDEPNPPLFMIILHFWIKIFGNGPFSVRAVPIFFNALTTVFLYFTGKKFFGIWSGIIASGLFIFSTYHFFFGSDTRAYSMLSCATAASLFYFLSTLKNPEKVSNLVALFIANFFLVYSHYFGWFIIFIQFISGILFLKDKKSIKRLLMVIIATAIIYIPMIKVLVTQFIASSKGTWLTPPDRYEFINQLKWFMNSGRGLNIALIIIGIGVIVALVSKIKFDKWRELFVILMWWIIPYSIMFFISEKIPMFTNRYILFNSIGFYLFISSLVVLLFSKVKPVLPVIALILLVVSFSKLEQNNFVIKKVKEATDYTQTKVTENSLILIFPQWANLGFVYYFRPDLFTKVENYYSILQENKIIPAWGLKDARTSLSDFNHDRVIYYNTDATSIDPDNAIYNYLDSTYHQVDSAVFEGGIKVNIFDKMKPSLLGVSE